MIGRLVSATRPTSPDRNAPCSKTLNVEPSVRFELTTCCLQDSCSTPELTRRGRLSVERHGADPALPFLRRSPASVRTSPLTLRTSARTSQLLSILGRCASEPDSRATFADVRCGGGSITTPPPLLLSGQLDRWRPISNMAMAPATLAFSDESAPLSWMRAIESQRARTRRDKPSPSAPMTTTSGSSPR